jgi:hypothetical protein
MTDNNGYDNTAAQLHRLIGEVAGSMATLEEALDSLIMDLLVLPPMFGFFQKHVLEWQTIKNKLALLEEYAEANRSTVRDADGALDWLSHTRDLCTERNRLVHWVHEYDSETGDATRRKVGRDDASPVTANEYRHVAWSTFLAAASGVEDLAEALTPATVE